MLLGCSTFVEPRPQMIETDLGGPPVVTEARLVSCLAIQTVCGWPHGSQEGEKVGKVRIGGFER